jgi:hypothetical protein
MEFSYLKEGSLLIKSEGACWRIEHFNDRFIVTLLEVEAVMNGKKVVFSTGDPYGKTIGENMVDGVAVNMQR